MMKQIIDMRLCAWENGILHSNFIISVRALKELLILYNLYIKYKLDSLFMTKNPALLVLFRLFVKPKARLITLIMSAIIQFQCMQRKGCDDILLLFLIRILILTE